MAWDFELVIFCGLAALAIMRIMDLRRRVRRVRELRSIAQRPADSYRDPESAPNLPGHPPTTMCCPGASDFACRASNCTFYTPTVGFVSGSVEADSSYAKTYAKTYADMASVAKFRQVQARTKVSQNC